MKDYSNMFANLGTPEEEWAITNEAEKEENPYGNMFRGLTSEPEQSKTMGDVMDTLGYGISRSSPMTESAANIMEAKFPMGRIESDDPGVSASNIWDYSPLVQMFKRAQALRYVPPTAEFMRLRNAGEKNAAMDQLQKEKQARLEEVWGDKDIDREGGGALAGEIIGTILDPTTLLPLGAPKVVQGVNLTRLGRAMTIGGGLAGAEVGLAHYSGHIGPAGDVDPMDVALATAGGAVITGAVAALGNFFRWRRLQPKLDKGVPVEKADLDNLDEYGAKAVDELIEDPDKFIDAINQQFNLTPEVPVQGIDEAAKIPWTGPTVKAKVTRAAKEAEAASKYVKSTSKKKVPKLKERQNLTTKDIMAGTTEELVPTERFYDNVEGLIEDAQLSPGRIRQLGKSTTGKGEGYGLESVSPKVIAKTGLPTKTRPVTVDEYLQNVAIAKKLSGKYVPVKGTSTPYEDMIKLKQEGDAWSELANQRAKAREKQIADSYLSLKPAEVSQELVDTYALMKPSRAASVSRKAKADRARIARDREDVISRMVGLSDQAGEARATVASIVEDLTPPEELIPDKFMRNKQRGAINNQLMTHIASGAVGGLTGHAVDPDGGGAVLGTALGLGVSTAAARYALPRKVALSAKTRSNQMDWAKHFTAAWTHASPTAVLEKGSIHAQKLAYNVKLARDNSEIAIAKVMGDMREVAADLDLLDKVGAWPKETSEQVMAVLQKELAPSKVPPNIRMAAEHIRKAFDKAVRDSVEVGLIAKDKGDELLAKAKTKGYWPRVYDDDFLNTAAGEEKWVEVLTSSEMDEDTAKGLLQSVLGEKTRDVSDVLTKSKTGENRFKFTPSIAKEILRQRKRYVASGRSVHMEKTRKLHVKSEAILKPFLRSNPEEVVAAYMQDVYKQIEYARIFKGNDEKAIGLLGAIGDSDGHKMQRVAAEVYWAAVGDPKSYSIKQQMTMNEGVRTFMQKIDAFETLKLSMAQVINMGQATINGSVAMSNYAKPMFYGSTNPFRVGKLALRAFIDTDKQQMLPGFLTWDGLGDFGRGTALGRTVAEYSGASFETTIIQYIGEHSNASGTLLGRNITGVFKPLNALNNPTEFLHRTGFIAVEKFQRDLAANMGFQAAKDLLERKAKAVASKDFKNIAKIDRHLKELGISNKANPRELLEGIADEAKDSHEMLRAGLRFSNLVNFRNVAEEMPLLSQSPYAKIFRKFKTFAFHQGKFFKNKVIMPAVTEGNFTPLLMYAAMAGIPGAAIYDLRQWLSGAEPEEREHIAQRLSDGFSTIGAAGLFWDTLGSTAYGMERPWMAFGGPAIADASKMWHATMKTWDNADAHYMLKAAVNTMVFPGKKAMLKDWKSNASAEDSQNMFGGMPDSEDLFGGDKGFEEFRKALRQQ